MLTKMTLKHETGDTIYQRGEELYGNGSIREFHLESNELYDEAQALVQGSGNLVYHVKLTYSWNNDFIAEYICQCAAYRNYDGMCKHCAAVALKYIDSCKDRKVTERLQPRIGQQLAYRSFTERSNKALPQTSPGLSRLLRQRVLKRTLPITEHTHYGRMLLIPELERDGEGTWLSLSVGEAEGHKYVVKDIVTLVRAVKQNQSFSYGRKLSFVHAREVFAGESRALLDFVCDWSERNQEYYRQVNSQAFYFESDYTTRLRKIPLTETELEEFINVMDRRPFQGTLYGQTEKLWQETDEKLPRVLTIRGGEEGIHVSVNLCEACRGKKDIFYFLDGKIYRAGRDEEDCIRDFLDCFQNTTAGKPLFVADRDVPSFCREVLPSLEQLFTPDYISFDKEEYGVKEVSFRIYLDAPWTDVYTCKIYAVYGEDVYDLLQGSGITSARDAVREIQVGQQVKLYFNKYDEELGRLELFDDNDMAYELLTRGIPEFQTLGEVFISDALKQIKVTSAPRPSVGVSLSGDLLELTMTAQDLSTEELLEILSKYDRKKKYFRLKSGEFINMEGEAIGALLELKEGLGLSDGQIKSGSIKLPKYRALYLDAEAREWTALGVERNREFRSLVRNMKTVEDNDFELPLSLAEVLREYQKKGFLWLKTLKHNGFGGILADDMGLGKTLQVIALLLAETTEAESAGQPLALIVCPASLVYNWNSEINRFAPKLPVKMITGSIQERQSLLEDCRPGEILVTSYDLLKRDLELYQPHTFAVQVIDEAQYIKNYNTQAARAVKEVKAGFKLALTGTPIENRLSELWSIFDYLMPGYLYSYSHFRNDYEAPIVQNQDERARKRLQKMIRPFVLRRLKKDVLTDLPDKLEENLYARLEGEQQELYNAHVQRLRLTLGQESEEEFRKGKIQILAELTKLRQLCCDPELLYENYRGESAKTRLCLDIVQNAVSGGHKILLFSQFTTMLDRICDEFRKEGISYFILTGATSKEERRRLVESFQTDDTSVFCISLRAGGTGLNLTAADIVIHYDPWWNLAVQNQATDRTHRIGQENVVNVYKLIAKGTIEEKIMQLQEKKKELADQMLNAEEIGSGSFSREELLELLG